MVQSKLLVLVVLIFLSSCTSDKSFSLPNPSAITSVELFDKTDSTRLHRANDGIWRLGTEQIPTNTLKVKNLLEILMRITVEYPLPLADQKELTADLLHSEGLQVRVYNGKKLVKSYSLFFPDKYDCVGVLKGKQQVYCLYFPGASIQLADYLSASPQFWMNNVVFDYSPAQIQQIEVQNYTQPSESFRLTKGEDGTVQLFSIDPEKRVPVDSLAVKRYITYFQGVTFEDYLQIPKDELEAIANAKAMYSITIKGREDAKTYRAVAKKSPTNDYDRDNFYLVLDNKQVVLAKWVNFDILFKSLSELAFKE